LFKKIWQSLTAEDPGAIVDRIVKLFNDGAVAFNAISVANNGASIMSGSYNI